MTAHILNCISAISQHWVTQKKQRILVLNCVISDFFLKLFYSDFCFLTSVFWFCFLFLFSNFCFLISVLFFLFSDFCFLLSVFFFSKFLFIYFFYFFISTFSDRFWYLNYISLCLECPLPYLKPFVMKLGMDFSYGTAQHTKLF